MANEHKEEALALLADLMKLAESVKEIASSAAKAEVELAPVEVVTPTKQVATQEELIKKLKK